MSPKPIRIEPSNYNSQVWQTKLCSGCSLACGHKPLNCCVNVCCSGFGAADVAYKYKKGGWVSAGVGALIMYGGPLACCFLACLRSEVRSVHGIEGNCCGDLCASLFCASCALSQMQTQAKTLDA